MLINTVKIVKRAAITKISGEVDTDVPSIDDSRLMISVTTGSSTQPAKKPAIRPMGSPISVSPVSYTHLDVYKRQSQSNKLTAAGYRLLL